jgi:CDP-diacylglycerol---glycerol-3-phosphate 3-phosphatidyltransferase
LHPPEATAKVAATKILLLSIENQVEKSPLIPLFKKGETYGRGEEVKITTSNSQPSMDKLQVIRKSFAALITSPLVNLLAKSSVTPNMVTWFGFFIILAAAALAAFGHPFAAGWVVLLSGFFDIIDGALARKTNQVTRFGGILDSTLDRASEVIMLIGIMAFYLFNPELYNPWIIILIGFTIMGSFLVSYVRARAEALKIDCQVGIFTRAERVIILALGLLLSSLPYVLVGALAIIALLSIITTIQRLVHTAVESKK